MFQNGAIPFKMEASRFRLMKPHFDATVKKTDFVFGLIDASMECSSRWNIWNIPDHIICHNLWLIKKMQLINIIYKFHFPSLHISICTHSTVNIITVVVFSQKLRLEQVLCSFRLYSWQVYELTSLLNSTNKFPIGRHQLHKWKLQAHLIFVSMPT